MENIRTSDSPYRFARLTELINENLPINVSKAASILRDHKGLQNTDLGLANEMAINQFIAHHSVIFQPEKRLMWVSTSPWQCGKYVAYDLNKIFKDTIDWRNLMSDTYYGLSKMEYNLMKYFWNTNAPVSFSEVEKYCNTELHYGWAQPTLHTYLTRLVKKGILHSEGKGYKCKRSYYPELTEQELAHKYATDFVDNTFNGSISDLLVSLTYNTKLSESDIEELKNIINNNTCD